MNSKTKIDTSQAEAYAVASGKSRGHRARAASLRPLANISARSIKSQIFSAGKDDTGAAVVDVACRAPTGAPGAYLTPLPQGTPSDSTPINNMGVTTDCDTTALEGFQDIAFADYVDLVMSDTGEVKQLLTRVPTNGQCSIIDWVNLTVLEDTWFKTSRQTLISDEQILNEASRYLEKIFGFGITLHRDKGMNFYRDSWVLGDDFGFVCFGGQRQTMLITLNGLGCASAVQGWEKRLYEFITTIAVRPVISRCDVAHDDFDGCTLSVDWAEEQWHSGGYTAQSGGQPPSIERIGNWHRQSGKGRTLTIGRRTSGKFTRFYEKGKKEGDKASLWLRAEVEFKNSDRVIPFEILLSPSDYFAATYPCFAQFAQVETPKRIAVKQKTAQIVIDACVEVTRHQFGKYLRVFRELYGDKETLDLVCNPDKDAWPKRMKPLTATAETSPTPLHRQEQEKPFVLPFINFIKSVASNGLNAENGFPKAHYA
jgi:phage replication initiation protein